MPKEAQDTTVATDVATARLRTLFDMNLLIRLPAQRRRATVASRVGVERSDTLLLLAVDLKVGQKYYECSSILHVIMLTLIFVTSF
jgi:hypothetical protein